MHSSLVLHFSVRQNRLRMTQEAQRDAPDPRESRPPCYADAILMPRLDGSFASLDELGTGRLKHKRRRRKTEESEEIEEVEVPLRRNRCRSEEVLSMREVVAASLRSPLLPPRIHPTEIEPIDRNISTNEEEQPVEGIHYHSTDILTLDHSPGPSSRARSPQTSLQPADESFEEIKNFNHSNNTLERSPYAKRKLGHMGSFKGDKATKLSSAPTIAPPQAPIEIHEDHFKTELQRRVSSSSEDSSEFITIKAGKHESSNSSGTEDSMVVIHKPTNI